MVTAPLMADDSEALICPRWPPMTFIASGWDLTRPEAEFCQRKPEIEVK